MNWYGENVSPSRGRRWIPLWNCKLLSFCPSDCPWENLPAFDDADFHRPLSMNKMLYHFLAWFTSCFLVTWLSNSGRFFLFLGSPLSYIFLLTYLFFLEESPLDCLMSCMCIVFMPVWIRYHLLLFLVLLLFLYVSCLV